MYLVTSKKLAQKLSWAVKETDVSKGNVILLPDGEAAKEWKVTEALIKKFIKLGLDRKSIVLVLGGGSVGDTVGFASSIYLRGIRYIQIPTTLLAQVDSAHGGKVGINFLHTKNQIGTFHLPLAIIMDARFIRTLSNEQIVDGLGEIIKAGLIKDPSILLLLRKEKVKTLAKSRKLKLIIDKAIRVKESYISKDFKDKGQRQILNFGHTVGHALELKYKISHGRAVLIGMLQELEIAERLAVTPPRIHQNLLRLLRDMGIVIKTNIRIDWKTLLRDKKISGNTIALPIIEKEGKSKLVNLDMRFLFAPHDEESPDPRAESERDQI